MGVIQCAHHTSDILITQFPGTEMYDPGFNISINKSPVQFRLGEQGDAWTAQLQQRGLPGDCMTVEITEGLLLDASQEVSQQLTQMRQAGMHVAMDDFGTGYSSLSYLKKFPIDVIKIDRSFIKDIPDSQDDMEITSAVIAMAHNLKLKVVAEGIETAEQLAFLRRHRCDVGQGYLFDRPIPGAELMQRLKRYPRGPIA